MNCRLILATALLAATTLSAQQGPPKSPPATESATLNGKSVTITYSSPRVNGRAGQIFSKEGLIGKDPSYPIWRAGANAATRLHTDADLMLGSLMVPKGDYSLWVDISYPNNWVLIVNKQSGQWGRTYDAAQNLGTAKMTNSATPALVENLKYTIADGKLTLAWENHAAFVAIMAH